MNINKTYYAYFARFIGLALTLYGGAALFVFSSYVVTGTNDIEHLTNGMGLVFITLMGAFSFPLGIAVFRIGEHTELLLRIAAAALAINALIRMSLVMVPEVIEITGGSTSVLPSGESLVFATLAIVTFTLRPKIESKQNSVPASI